MIAGRRALLTSLEPGSPRAVPLHLPMSKAIPATSEDAADAGPIVRLTGISKAFGDMKVLQDVSFQVKPAETFAIIGPSGCGKSVTLKIIMGLLRCDSGSVEIFGQNVTDAPESTFDLLRRRMSMVFQGGALFDSMTVGENVGFALDQHTKLPDAEKKEIVDLNLDRVGLPGIANKMPSDLSGGMRKRVALARSLTLEPELILFDEPTTGLDPIMTTEIGLLVTMLRDKFETASILVSHDIKNALEISDRIGVHYKGRLVTIGTPDEIRNCSDPFVRQFLLGLPNTPEGEAA